MGGMDMGSSASPTASSGFEMDTVVGLTLGLPAAMGVGLVNTAAVGTGAERLGAAALALAHCHLSRGGPIGRR